MPATVIVGAQWGDEGKGKIVDLLAQDSDLVCRYQGGPNAGHTIVVGDETYKIRALPSGIVRGTPCVIGNGCVVDPEVLIAELDEFEQRGRPTGEVYLSGNAHLIMPWHLAIDQASERRLGKLAIGTTKRGIGPCYADKAMRLGIRVQDILDPKILRQKIEVALAEKNLWLERVYETEPFDLETVAGQYEGYAQRLRPLRRRHVALRRHGAARREARPLRGRAGDAARPRPRHVSVRHVVATRSRRARRSASGSGRRGSTASIGVAKAYVTRVGEGPFPSEIDGADQARMRELGGEYGTVTGRERRCGWLDLVALRYAVRVNGIDQLALTKLDVLSHFAELPVCVRYRTPRRAPRRATSRRTRATSTRPSPSTRRSRAGASRSTAARSVDELPDAARGYVEFVERELDVEVTLVGTGAERASVLSR